jgi:ABC-type glycerol-3-phosphate transport system substrate-binding protein
MPMSQRKRFASLAAVGIAVLSLWGCSKSSDSDVLKIALDIEDEGRFDELFAAFEAATGVTVSATYGIDASKLIGTSEEPDIFKTSTVSVISMKDNYLALDDLIAADSTFQLSDYLDSIIDALTVDGHVYALPTSINTSLLYYNKTLFDASASAIRTALGLGATDSVYPQADWTYDDFQKAGVALSQYTLDGDTRTYSQFGADNQLTWWGEWLVYLNQMGGSFYEPDSDNHILGITTQEAIDATTYWREKAMGDATEKFAPNAVEVASGYSFANGNVAMLLGGHLGDWYSYDLLGLDWDVQILPTPVGLPDATGGEISADAFGISKRSSKASTAFQFLKYWTGETGALEMYDYGKIGALKSMESLIESLPSDQQRSQNVSALFEAIDKAEPLPQEEYFSYVMESMVMTELYKLMLTGRSAETDVTAVLTTIKTNVDEFYEGIYGS